MGLGLGSCLAWSLNIFEIAHPRFVNCGGGQCSTLYPDMALTVFALLAFCGAFGVGLGLMASALTRSEDTRQAGAPTTANPAEPERNIFGFLRES